MRQKQEDLWKTVTMVSSQGRMKGRAQNRQRPTDMYRRLPDYGKGRVISSEIPGLNTKLDSDKLDDALLVGQPVDPVKTQDAWKKVIDISVKQSRRLLPEKYHQKERGFHGVSSIGQKMGPPFPIDGQSFEGFESYCLMCKRTAQMVPVVGRKHSVSCLVVTGNGKGLFGWATVRVPWPGITRALVSARQKAATRLMHIELLDKRTLFQDFYGEAKNTRLWAQRRPRGYGLCCHRVLIKLCELIGIEDIYVKTEGSTKNYRTLTEAFLAGLLNQETHQQLAERTRLHVVQMSRNTHFLPRIVASPIKNPVRQEQDVQPNEKLELDEYYGQGRYPLHRPPPKPFYWWSEGNQKKLRDDQPFRNEEQVKIRMLADDTVPRWTRLARKKWSKERHEMAMNGLVAVPQGLGLTVVDREGREDEEKYES